MASAGGVCRPRGGLLFLRLHVFRPVGVELVDAFGRERVVEEHFEDFEGDCRVVGSGFGAFEDVGGVAQARGYDLGLDAVGVVDVDYVVDELEAVFADVVEASDEGADVGRARGGGEYRLVRGEDERDVGFDAERGEFFDRAEAVGAERYFDDDLRVNLGDDLRLFDELGFLKRYGFGADGAVDDLGYFAHARVEVDVPLFGDERRVGGYAGDYAPRAGFFDFVEVGCVEEKFHFLSPFRIMCIFLTRRVRVMFFVGGRAAFGFALASVHFRDFAAEREAEDDAQEHDDGEDDYALQVGVAYRPDYVGGHEELEAEHERLFEREAQVQPFVFCGAAAREREAQAARDRRGDAAEYDDYADEFYRRAGVFGEEVERVRRGAEDFHDGAISSAGRRRGRSIPARGPPTPIFSAWRVGSAPSRIRRRRATLWSSA